MLSLLKQVKGFTNYLLLLLFFGILDEQIFFGQKGGHILRNRIGGHVSVSLQIGKEYH